MKRFAVIVAVVLLSLLNVLPAQAHRFAPSRLQLDWQASGAVQVLWKTPIQQVSDTPLQPVLPQGCAVQSTSPWVQEGTGKLLRAQWQCEGNPIGHEIAVSGLAENQASVLMTVSLPGDVHHQAILNDAAPAWSIPAEPTALAVVGNYTVLGAEHIGGGLDHLLFVLGLLLLVGGGRRLVLTITAFTVGHSVTLALVVLGYMTYPVAVVEFLIAVSIFVLALELGTPERQSRLWRQPWWLASGFGLLHGMGFAGALVETGLPQTQIPLALLFFNIGIEIGQLLFITLLFIAALLGRRLLGTSWTRARWLPVYTLGGLSAMWCIERGLEVLV